MCTEEAAWAEPCATCCHLTEGAGTGAEMGPEEHEAGGQLVEGAEGREAGLSHLHKQNRGKLLEASIQCVIVQP